MQSTNIDSCLLKSVPAPKNPVGASIIWMFLSRISQLKSVVSHYFNSEKNIFGFGLMIFIFLLWKIHYTVIYLSLIYKEIIVLYALFQLKSIILTKNFREKG